MIVKGFKEFSKKLYESKEEEELEPRFGDKDHKSRMELLNLFEEMIKYINKFKPTTQEKYEKFKEEIKDKKEDIMSHPQFDEFKSEGMPWQDSILYIDDILDKIKDAIMKMSEKAAKNGLY